MRSGFAIAFLAMAGSLFAQEQSMPRPKYLQGVSIEQKLNAQVPLQAQFKDEFGRPVTLGTYMTGRPAILVLGYYTCPALCDQIEHAVAAGLRSVSFKPGRDFDLIFVSINPNEKPPQAAEKRLSVVNMYKPGTPTTGWHFLTGNEQNIRLVTDAVGYHYRYDPASKMFFHAAGIMVLTPEGKVARYLYGVYYEPKDLKLALVEASHHQIGSPVDEILLFCCRYDAVNGKYTLAIYNLLRVAAAGFLVFLVGAMVLMSRRGKFAGKAHAGLHG